MTLFRNTAEGGVNGAGVTLGNSDDGTSGDPLRTNITGAGSTLTYTSTAGQFSEGAMGFKHVWVAGGQSCLRCAAGFSSTNFAISFDFKFSATLTATHELADVWSGTGGATDHIFKMFVNADGTIRARDRTGSTAGSNTAALSGIGMTPLVNGTWYRCDIVIIPGTGTTDGTIKWRVCLQGSNTPVTGANISATAVDAGTTPIIDWYIVCPENHTVAGEMYSDDIRWQDAAAGAFIGAYVAPTNAAPTVAAITKVLRTQGQTVTATMVPTDTDGTIGAWEWVPLSWPVGAAAPSLTGAATATFTSSALTVPGIYTFGYRARDNALAWSAQSIFRVGVAASDSTAAVRGIRSNPGGYAGTVDDINDTSSATGMTSPNGPSGAVITYDMDPVVTTDISIPYFETELVPDSTGASCSIVVDIISGTGTTVAATRTFTVTDPPTNRPIVLTSGENAALADRIDWAIRFTTTQI